jgi:ArsR family transcriptional regulator
MDYKEDVRLAKALADESRLAILESLKSGEKCACVLLEALRITQPTLSHHMKILCDAGLVDGVKEGKWMHYSLSPEGTERLLALAKRYGVPS